MSAARRTPGAFTLIELLVVVAILALLIAMLIPALSRAKAITMRVVCMNNLKHIGRLIYQFAGTHQNRAPGHCMGYRNGDPAQEARGRGWVGYLNVEVLGQRRYWQTNASGFIQQIGWKPKPNWLYCPSIAPFWNASWSNIWARTYLFNLDLNGGPGWQGSGNPPWGPYGINVMPPPCNPLPDDFVPYWEYYGLGAQIEKFRNPSYQFAIWETEAGSDVSSARWPYNPVVLNDPSYPDRPPWTALGGFYAFRHVLPYDVSLYQQQATANFLYIDGHVNTMTANETINVPARFDLTQN